MTDISALRRLIEDAPNFPFLDDVNSRDVIFSQRLNHLSAQNKDSSGSYSVTVVKPSCLHLASR